MPAIVKAHVVLATNAQRNAFVTAGNTARGVRQLVEGVQAFCSGVDQGVARIKFTFFDEADAQAFYDDVVQAADLRTPQAGSFARVAGETTRMRTW